MRSRIEHFALALLPACALHTSFSDPANGWTVSSAAVCQGQSAQVLLTPKDPVTLTDTAGNVQVPTVTLVSGSSQIPLTATWNGSAVVADVVATLAAGTYDIKITRESDHAVTTLKSALQVAGTPANLQITGQTACTAQKGTLVFTVTGDNVGTLTAVTLSGVDTGPLATTPGPASNSLSVSVPLADKTPGTSYAITVSNGDGCSTAYTGQGVQIEPPPTVVGDPLSGPHLHSGALAQNTAVTVRVTGTALTSGTVVAIGGVSATSVVASSDNTSLDATFAPNTLVAAKALPIKVANATCQATLTTKVDVGAADMTLSRISPNGWVAGQQGVFFDAFGELSQAGAGAVLWVNTSGSIFTDEWQQIQELVQLDAAGNAYRFANPSSAALTTTTGSGVANISVTSSDGSHEAFALGGVTLSAAAAPRIVWKDKDWVAANGSASDSLSVFGCGLSGASFKLVDANGSDVANGALSAASTNDAGWAEAQFKCTDGGNPGDFANDTVILQTAAALQHGGPYRIRAFVPAISGQLEVDEDDLYPIMAYDEANLALSTTTVAPTTPLRHARKNPNALVAGDATGRRYVYLIGGAFNDGLTDPSEGAGDPTYEFAALDPNNGLMPWAIYLSGAAPFPLAGDDYTFSYGMAAASDGTRIYFAGGAATSTADTCTLVASTTCNATSHVRQAAVTDPTLGTSGGPLDALVSPSSGNSGATGNPVLTSMCSGACDTTLSYGDARYGAQAEIVNDSGTRKLIVFGGYTDEDNPAGSSNSQLLYVFDLSTTGLVANPGATDFTPAPTAALLSQAPESLTQIPPASGFIADLTAALGFFAGGNESRLVQHITVAAKSGGCHAKCACDTSTIPWQYCSGTTKAATGTSLNANTCESSSTPTCDGTQACFRTGDASLTIGSTQLLLGGTDRQCETAPDQWTGPSAPASTSLTLDLSAASAAPTGGFSGLLRERSLAGRAFIPPFELLVAGVQCKNPGACTSDSSNRAAVANMEVVEVH